jgi:hypothetical protein
MFRLASRFGDLFLIVTFGLLVRKALRGIESREYLQPVVGDVRSHSLPRFVQAFLDRHEFTPVSWAGATAIGW